MDTTPATAVLGALVVVLLVVTVTTAVLASRSRRRAAADVASARAETARLAERVDALGEQLVRPTGPTAPGAADAAYVITDAGTRHDADGYDARPMARDTYVLNAALGEPLVKAVALGHGVRRALSAESRARIRVVVRQETRRARKQRRREMREVWLAHKRAGRGGPNAAQTPGQAPGPTAAPTGTADAA